MAQAAVLALLTSLHVIQPWMVLVLAFAFGTVNAFDLPARQSFLVEMVEKGDLTNAIALNSSAFNMARIVGPAIAGILVALLGEAGCFWVNALSYLAVIWGLWVMRIDHPRHEPSAQHPWHVLREGVGYAWRTTPIRNLLLLLGFMAGFGFQFMVLLGTGLYLPYVAVHTTIFERLIAIMRDRGNLGFLMYVADSAGYFGYVILMVAQGALPSGGGFLRFFEATCAIIGVLTCVSLGVGGLYFARRGVRAVPAGAAS